MYYQNLGLEKLTETGNLDANAFSFVANGNTLTIESTAKGKEQKIKVWDGSSGYKPLIVETVESKGTDAEYQSAGVGITFSVLTKEQVLGKGITVNNQTILFRNTAGTSSDITDFAVDVESVTDNESLVAEIARQLGDKLEGVILSASGNTLTVTATAQAEAGNGIVISDGAALGGGANPSNLSLNLHIGANAGQTMNIEFSDMRAAKLGLVGNGDGYTSDVSVTNGTSSELKERALDMSSHDSSDKAITVIDNAIKTVSEERSKLGAYQNRLEHTISNLGTSAENLQAAESRIRDVDMSEEMMSFTKSNILNQAATAMLAQANMAPQSVLQLLG